MLYWFRSVHSAKAISFPATCFLFLCLLILCAGAKAQNRGGKPAREYIQIRVYHAVDSAQLSTISRYLQASFMPALKAGGFQKIGAFTAIANDTAIDKKLYVFIPFSSLEQLTQLSALADKTITDTSLSFAYATAAYNRPPYQRFETILLQAFTGAPRVTASAVKGPLQDRVYELRSYESATEALHKNKVQMFNSGEVELFQRLGFNAVFYGQVMAGSRMPNLMYMTSFDNKASRDEHWKNFGGDPEWKTMSAKPEYQHNVSKNEIVFLRPLPFSGL